MTIKINLIKSHYNAEGHKNVILKNLKNLNISRDYNHTINVFLKLGLQLFVCKRTEIHRHIMSYASCIIIFPGDNIVMIKSLIKTLNPNHGKHYSSMNASNDVY